jgi:hypothetical protein
MSSMDTAMAVWANDERLPPMQSIQVEGPYNPEYYINHKT